MDSNKFTRLPPTIGQLSALEELTVARNELDRLPNEMGKLSSLRSLNVRSNRLNTLPPTFKQLNQLTELELSENNFSQLPPCVGNLRRLTNLSLRENQLTTLPASLSNLSNLTELDVSLNNLSRFPAFIVHLNKLQTLYLGNNAIERIPPEIQQLHELTAFYMQSNRLTAIPKEFGQLFRLRDLNLSFNKITNVPTELGNLYFLRYLDLDENPLEKLSIELINEGIYATMLFLNDGIDVTKNQRLFKLDVQLPKTVCTLMKQSLAFFNEFLQAVNPMAIEVELCTTKQGLRLEIAFTNWMDLEAISHYFHLFMDCLQTTGGVEGMKLSKQVSATRQQKFKKQWINFSNYCFQSLDTLHISRAVFFKLFQQLAADLAKQLEPYRHQVSAVVLEQANPGPAN